MTNTAPATSSTPSSHRTVVPSEVGWQFVPQYYTFVNKQPDRLHCFYTKKSTFIHGTEGEDGKPCHGQQEIHAKITSLAFNDCKVFIHSVDAQSSADGGIIIQVIGEMSNNGEDWRKFVQTFFLAEQPNGYFVLNDIFRFLKEDGVDGSDADDDAVAEPIPEPAPAAPAAQEVYEPAPAPAPVAPPTPEPVMIEEPTTVAELPVEEPFVAAPAESVADPQPPVKVNGIGHAQEEKPAAPAAATPTQPTPVAEKSRSPAPPVAVPTPPPAAAPTTAPIQVANPTPAAAHAAPTPAAAQATPNKPAAPKTWANLAAANSKKWGSAVAQESRGTSEVVVPPSPAAHSAPPPQTPNPGPGGRSAHPALVQAQTISTAQCFIKGVPESLPLALLNSTLTSRFGPLKDLEIVRTKMCAFGEFLSIESARRAIIASLHQAQGGEGGVWIDLPGPPAGDGGQVRIVVDTRKERSERPPSTRGRGGPPGGGGGRGGFEGGQGQGGPGGNGNPGGGSGFRGRGRGRGGPAGK